MKALIILPAFAIASILHSCNKDNDCYDPVMEQEHSGICTSDCPGVCGCDGNFYCNECVANSKGIRVVSDGPCDE